MERTSVELSYDIWHSQLWTLYDSYSYRLELSLFSKPDTTTTIYNSKTGTLLHSNWLGFTSNLKLLTILDYWTDVEVDQDNPIEVVVGLQSKMYKIVTAVDTELLTAKITFDFGSQFVSFDPSVASNNVMEIYSYQSTAFRVSAASTEL